MRGAKQLFLLLVFGGFLWRCGAKYSQVLQDVQYGSALQSTGQRRRLHGDKTLNPFLFSTNALFVLLFLPRNGCSVAEQSLLRFQPHCARPARLYAAGKSACAVTRAASHRWPVPGGAGSPQASAH